MGGNGSEWWICKRWEEKESKLTRDSDREESQTTTNPNPKPNPAKVYFGLSLGQ